MQLLPITEAVDRGLTANPVVAQVFTPGEGWYDLRHANEVATRNLLRCYHHCGVRSVALEHKRAGRTVLRDFNLLPGGKLS